MHFLENMEHYWDNEFIVKIPTEDSSRIGISDIDSVFLYMYGIPQFCAPHISLIYPFSSSDNFLEIGYNQYEKNIEYNLNTREIRTYSENNEELFISYRFENFIQSPMYFADLIEESISKNGKNAFLERSVPSYLIEYFLNNVSRLNDIKELNGFFWNHECNRLFID